MKSLGHPLIEIIKNISGDLPKVERREFSDAITLAADGKDLSVVHWQLWDAELQALPQLLPKDIEILINQVIAGMKLRAAGKEWPDAAKVAKAVYAAVEVVAEAADAAYTTVRADADYVAAKTFALCATYAAAHTASPDAEAHAVAFVTDYATHSATCYAAFSAVLAVEITDIRIRQRETLLALIKNAKPERIKQ